MTALIPVYLSKAKSANAVAREYQSASNLNVALEAFSN